MNLFYTLFLCANSYSEMVAVVNLKSPLTEISKSELKMIYTGRKVRWGNNEITRPATVVNKKFNKVFVTNVLKMDYKRYQTYWKKAIFTGKLRPPKSFKDTRKMLDYINRTTGAIGVVERQNVTSNVKILKLNR